MNYRLQEKIDLYNAGRMSDKEAMLFEKELESDPSLLSESNFQKDIINGLKDYRKSQLKARLNTVDLNPTWIEFVQQSTLLKSFGGVAVASLIGAGVYYLAESDPEMVEEKVIVIDAPHQADLNLNWNIKAATSTPTDVQVTNTTPVFTLVKETQSDPMPEQVDAAKTDAKIFNPSFEAPIAEEVEDEEAFETASLEQLPETSNLKTESSTVEVDYENTDEIIVKYKYYDGKLFLSGDFDKAPYEILEINSANGRRIYVKYLEKFYQVGITDKLTVLPEVLDVNLIQELKLLRQNK